MVVYGYMVIKNVSGNFILGIFLGKIMIKYDYFIIK